MNNTVAVFHPPLRASYPMSVRSALKNSTDVTTVRARVTAAALVVGQRNTARRIISNIMGNILMIQFKMLICILGTYPLLFVSILTDKLHRAMDNRPKYLLLILCVGTNTFFFFCLIMIVLRCSFLIGRRPRNDDCQRVARPGQT